MTADKLKKLEKDLGYKFADRNILLEALTHSSQKTTQQNYERLEFLGDRVLGLLLADHFFNVFPDDDEGALSLRLHGEACTSFLAIVARKLKLADYIQSQQGLDVSGNDGLMADVVESIIAAIYLDSGLNAAKAFIEIYWPLSNHAISTHKKDAKSRLQELSLSRGLGLPVYHQVEKYGPDHAPQMTYEVKIKGYSAVRATAGSRKIAEQNSAKCLLEQLESGTIDS